MYNKQTSYDIYIYILIMLDPLLLMHFSSLPFLYSLAVLVTLLTLHQAPNYFTCAEDKLTFFIAVLKYWDNVSCNST
jgi:hypothetical protein